MTDQDGAPAHSPLGASSAHCWTRCPGSVEAKKLFYIRHPHWRGGSAAAAEGTEAHRLAEALCKDLTLPAPGDWLDTYPDREMLRHALGYRTWCFENVEEGDSVFIEARLKMSDIHASAFGTGDFICYQPRTRTCIILDLKYGQGVAVEATDNSQLIMYAEGARELIEGAFPDGRRKHIDHFIMGIFQPRMLGGVTTWHLTADQHRVRVDELYRAALQVDENPYYNPGTKQCRWCDAKTDCSAYANWLWERVTQTGHDLERMMNDITQGNTISNSELMEWIERFDGLVVYAKRLHEAAYHRALAGQQMPGKKLVDGQARYVADDESIEFLLGDEAYKPPVLRSMSDLKKSLGKRRFDDTVGPYFVKRPGTPHLVDSDDPRPAVPVTKVDVEGLFDALDD